MKLTNDKSLTAGKRGFLILFFSFITRGIIRPIRGYRLAPG